MAPARKPHNEIALRQTPGGFGTPEFEFDGAATQVRVDGAELVVSRDGEERRGVIESLAGAGEIVGPELLPDGVPTDSTPLAIDPEAAEQLGGFYELAAAALEEVRSGLPAEDESSDVNLWPEHFDIAFEAGPEADGKRANYGASPGDESHGEPYFYVGPWTAEVEGGLWNASGFKGAELTFAELIDAADQEATALEFFTARHDALRDG